MARITLGVKSHVASLALHVTKPLRVQVVGHLDVFVLCPGDHEGKACGGPAHSRATANYWGAYLAAKYGSGNIRAGGSIVFTSGTAGRRPRTGWTLVASICAAMEGLTRALAVELAPIRVNIVSPYVVKTALWAEMAEADRAALYRRTAEKLPVGDPQNAARIVTLRNC